MAADLYGQKLKLLYSQRQMDVAVLILSYYSTFILLQLQVLVPTVLGKYSLRCSLLLSRVHALPFLLFLLGSFSESDTNPSTGPSESLFSDLFIYFFSNTSPTLLRPKSISRKARCGRVAIQRTI